MEPLDRTFAALSDPTRRGILRRLRHGEASVTELVGAFALRQPTISKHLKALEEAGLVTRGRDAQRRPCRLTVGPLDEASRWLAEVRGENGAPHAITAEPQVHGPVRIRPARRIVLERSGEDAELAAARAGDSRAFAALVEPHRRSLHAHCYRMLGGLADTDDALQETLVAAWQGLRHFEGRSSIFSWLRTIATHASLRIATRRKRRLLPQSRGAAGDPRADLEPRLESDEWVEPYPGGSVGHPPSGPEARYTERESLELAFVAALQRLPPNQRAALVLRDVVGASAEEVASSLGATLASVNGALQRARRTLAPGLATQTQAAAHRALGDHRVRHLVKRFVHAWDHADVKGIVQLLTTDATFTMPPLPTWFRGREAIGAFMAERVFAAPWRLSIMEANGQPALACYLWDAAAGAFVLFAINVLDVRDGRIDAITSFLGADVLARFGLPGTFPGGPSRAWLQSG